MRITDLYCLRIGYPPQSHYLIWNSHDHIILDYYVVLLHSSFLSRHTGYNEHVSVKQKLYQDSLKTLFTDTGLTLHISKG